MVMRHLLGARDVGGGERARNSVSVRVCAHAVTAGVCMFACV